ncbi:hypothetical protein IU11_06690 [Cellulosimicrobium sp. MM]|nr:hypothetical protein IU11_06690 [Cellulosimicrobium sp. MM]
MGEPDAEGECGVDLHPSGSVIARFRVRSMIPGSRFTGPKPDIWPRSTQPPQIATKAPAARRTTGQRGNDS